jgi:hypothetical protein
MKKWNHRFDVDGEFYGCVDRNLYWFDSATRLDAAMQWCRYYHGSMTPMSALQEQRWFNENATKLGFSIIHSSLLQQLVESGVVK